MSLIIRQYERTAADCRTVNELNQLHIALENRMTPEQLLAFNDNKTTLASCLNRSLVHRLYGWLDDLNMLFRPSSQLGLQKYRRIDVHRYLLLYTDGNPIRKHKTLVICFTGISGRMMMPTPVFLQQFDAQDRDVLYVLTPTAKAFSCVSKGYYFGIPGLGEDLLHTLDGIYDRAALHDYQRVVAIGSSSGGIPALLFALKFNLDCAMTIGAGSPTDTRWSNCLSSTPGELARQLCQKTSSRTRVFFVSGRDSDSDVEAAEEFNKILPGQTILAGKDGTITGHNVLHALLIEGSLKLFFEKTLFADG